MSHRIFYIPENMLRDLALDQYFSRRELAKVFGCGTWVIDQYLTEYGIKPRYACPDINLEILNGIKDYYLKRVPVPQIAKNFNVSTTLVRRILKESGVWIGIVPPITKEQILAGIAEGLTQGEIAKLYGLKSGSTICVHAKKHGIILTPQQKQPNQKIFVPKNSFKEELKSLLEEGYTYKEISRKYGMKDDSINNWVQKFGLQGISTKARFRTFEEIDWNEVKLFYNEGGTREEIELKYNTTRTIIDQAVSKGLIIIRNSLKLRNNISRPCELAKQYLREVNINYIEEFKPLKDRGFSIDIAWPDIKIGIEINGNRHYKNVTNEELTDYYQKRHDLIEAAGWKLYEIPCRKAYSNKIFLPIVEEIFNIKIQPLLVA